MRLPHEHIPHRVIIHASCVGVDAFRRFLERRNVSRKQSIWQLQTLSARFYSQDSFGALYYQRLVRCETPVFEGNQGAVQLAQNPAMNSNSQQTDASIILSENWYIEGRSQSFP